MLELKLKICSVCGKEFIPPIMGKWMYRIGQKWQCSYTCYRKAGGDNGKPERESGAAFVSSVRKKASKRKVQTKRTR